MVHVSVPTRGLLIPNNKVIALLVVDEKFPSPQGVS